MGVRQSKHYGNVSIAYIEEKGVHRGGAKSPSKNAVLPEAGALVVYTDGHDVDMCLFENVLLRTKAREAEHPLDTTVLGLTGITERVKVNAQVLLQSDVVIKTRLSLCSRRIVELRPALFHHTQLTSLQLCCNQLQTVPKEIAELKLLQTLSLAHNQIAELPEELCLLSNLKELNISRNQLKHLPSALGSLNELVTLIVSQNKLIELPQSIRDCHKLTHIDVCENPELQCLPSGVAMLKHLAHLRVEHCGFDQLEERNEPDEIMSLREIAARSLLLQGVSPSQHPYLQQAHVCAHCRGPYFERVVKRIRFIERGEVRIPLEAHLCRAHWNSEPERIRALFAPMRRIPLEQAEKNNIKLVHRSLSLLSFR